MIWALDCSHKNGNNFFIHHCQDWEEGSFVYETVWFFSWVNTHPFDLKFVEFCPKLYADSYVDFQENTISGQFFRNFVQTKVIIYQNLWNFALLSAILFRVRIALKKFTQVLSYVFYTQVRRHVPNKITKKKYGEKSQDVLFSENQFCSVSFWDLPRLTPRVFLYKIFTRRSSLSLLSLGCDLSTRLFPQEWQ